MKNRLKNGVTITSLVVYIVLFSSLTLFLSSTYTDLNERLFISRGKAINNTTFNKLQYNFINSANESNDVYVEGDYLIFSNGDRYTYNVESKCITLQDGVLCTNVENIVLDLQEGTGVKKVTLNIKLKKYLNELEKNIIVTVEE